MNDKHIDLQLRPAQQVHPLDLSIRVEGLEEEKDRAAVRLGVSQSLRRGRLAGSDMVAEQAQRVEGKIEVGLTGPSTSPQRQQDLHRLLRAAVEDELHQLTDRSGPFDVCVCASGVPGDRIGITAEDIRWSVDGVWTPPPSPPAKSGEDFWVIAVYLDSAPFNAARLILRNGATFDPPVPRNQVLVGLANATEWAKEIWAENLCSGRTGSVYQEGPNGTPRRMLLTMPACREGADTIVFRKPGLWGTWHDVGHFPPELFWQAFGGTVADFTWTFD